MKNFQLFNSAKKDEKHIHTNTKLRKENANFF